MLTSPVYENVLQVPSVSGSDLLTQTVSRHVATAQSQVTASEELTFQKKPEIHFFEESPSGFS